MANIVLQLGAHKTATTFVQKTLQKNKAKLLEAGVDVPNLSDLRAGVTQSLRQENGSRLQVNPAFRTIVLSDENIIGYPESAFSKGQFYPSSSERITNLGTRLPYAPREILFSIRPYLSYFPSTYALWLGDDRPQISRVDACKKVVELDRGWPEIVGEIRAAFPDSRITVTEYTPEKTFIERQFRILLDDIAAGLSYDTRYFWNKRLPAKRLPELEKLISGGNAEQREIDSLRQQKLRGRPKPVLEFWSEADEAVLYERYTRDRKAIQSMPDISFLA